MAVNFTEGNDNQTLLVADTYYGLGGSDVFFVNGGPITVFAGLGNDVFVVSLSSSGGEFFGEEGDDYFETKAIEAIFSGGAGADSFRANFDQDLYTLVLEGGAGADTYDLVFGRCTITELADGGTDTVRLIMTGGYTLPDFVENLELGSAFAGIYNGNVANNVISGSANRDTIYGLGGDDRLFGGNDATDDELFGGEGDDYIILDNLDTGDGSNGNDTYEIRHSAIQIFEGFTGGIDTAVTHLAAFDLSGFEGVENLTGKSSLSGLAVAQTLSGSNGNNIIKDNAAGFADVLNGLAGDDELHSRSGADTVNGGDGNDLFYAGSSSGTFNGGTGNDVFHALSGSAGNSYAGGTGDDTYDVFADISAVISENVDEGTDTILTAAASFNLSGFANIENLVGESTVAGQTFTGNAGMNSMTGSKFSDTLDGGAGIDTLIGGLGDDTYVLDNEADVVTEVDGEGTDTINSSASFMLSSNVETLVLTGTFSINGTGNAQDNIITGNDGNNVLDGGIGNDGLIGGLGDDTYMLGDEADAVTEVAGQGIDTITSLIARSLADTAYLAIENLTLTGSSAINGTGNALANTLTGNSAANTLNGGTGSDRMVGGVGNDTYVTDGGDTIVEASGGGTDLVQSSMSFTLGLNVEKLTLTGTAAIGGKGNTLANTITGNAAKNTLNGLSGNDTMNGGSGNDLIIGGTGRDFMSGNSGNDVFDFNLLSESGKTSTTRDVIKDFAVKLDDINLATIDASTKAAGNQAFKFISTQSFHKVAGELHYSQSNLAGTANDKTIISGDVNGDGKADFTIELTGLKGLTAGDFIL